jgi:hypothetical protein
MGILSRILGFLASGLGLILPVFARIRDFGKSGKPFRWTLHIIVIVLILIGLGVLNYVFDLQTFLPGANWLVRHTWLPLLFLLVYAFSWLGWWLWTLLGLEEEGSAFPDIDAAWNEAVAALRQADIELSEVPLFLVIGKGEGGEEAFFNAATAAPMASLVKYAPHASDAPIRLWATRDAAFISCAGASLLGRQAGILAGEEGALPETGGGAPDLDNPLLKSVGFATIRPTGQMEDVQKLLRQAFDEGRELSDAEKEQIRAMTGGATPETRKARPALLQNADETERGTARLRHLCKLIVRARQPHCPLNGTMVLVPFAGTDSDDDATQTGVIIQRDLATVQETLRLRFPVLTLVCDLEKADGFAEFLERFPADQRKQRLGQRHPWVPDVNPADLPKVIESEVDWICQGLLGNWIIKLFTLESKDKKGGAEAVKGNAQLFRFLCQLRDRDSRLARILTSFIRPSGSDRDGTLFGGCYVAGTGHSAGEQAFVAGVMHKLVESQNFVSWTPDAMAEEGEQGRWTRFGYAGLAAVAAGLAGLVWYLWR